MILPLLSALAVTLGLAVAVMTVVIPFVLGLCCRRDTH